MSPLDSLPADQRAVLQLVLQQGRSYDDLAKLLGISADAVRTRAHAGLETLGPDTSDRLDAERRGQISDYLLGQLSLSDRESVRHGLAGSAAGRAWARVLSDQLSPLARDGMPDVPDAAPILEPETREGPPDEAERMSRVRPAAGHEHEEKPAKPRSKPGDAGAGSESEGRRLDPADESDALVPAPSSSRLGGALLLGGLAIAAVALIILLFSGSDDKKSASNSSGPAPAPTSATGPSGATGPTNNAGATGATAQPKVVAQANLVPVKGVTTKALALVQLVVQGQQASFLIGAQGLDAPTTGSYAVWLFNNPNQAKFIAPITGGQIKGGQVTGLAKVPQDFTQYRSMVLTREPVANPKRVPARPGSVLLQGAIGAPPAAQAPAKKK
jgi:hypothetical protein